MSIAFSLLSEVAYWFTDLFLLGAIFLDKFCTVSFQGQKKFMAK